MTIANNAPPGRSHPDQFIVQSPSLLSNHSLVRFTVSRVKSAKVVWINHAWWLQNGWDTTDRFIFKSVCEWLLDNFAVQATEDKDVSHENLYLDADRYGSSHGSIHGGSGRCGSHGAFLAKGIGRTPLVGTAPDTLHGSGRLSMVEAIREIAGAELAQNELPFGAIPCVALIDLGEAAGLIKTIGDAVLVRPTFIRPAHFERSIFFGSAGFAGSDQHLDGLRVSEAVRNYFDPHTAAAQLQSILQRFADQIGSSWAQRLWQGRFLSSNVSITGELVDFGSFRSVPTWHRFYGEPTEEFGNDQTYLEMVFLSLQGNLFKHGLIRDAQTTKIKPDFEYILSRSFSNHCSNMLGLSVLPSSAADDISRALFDFFTEQQSERVQVANRASRRLPWLTTTFNHLARRRNAPEADATTIFDIPSILTDHSIQPAHIGNIVNTFQQWIRPRHQFSYEFSTKYIARLLRRFKGRDTILLQRDFTSTINFLLSSFSRFEHTIRPGLRILGQVNWGYSVALYTFDIHERRFLVLARGIKTSKSFHIFGANLPDISSSEISNLGWLEIPSKPHHIRTGLSYICAGHVIQIPPAIHFF